MPENNEVEMSNSECLILTMSFFNYISIYDHIRLNKFEIPQAERVQIFF